LDRHAHPPHFSTALYTKTSCFEKHDRFTLCGYHHNAGHTGSWKDCPLCRKEFPTEMYVHYGTNKWNFDKLENPPAYEPTKCSTCGKVIVLSKGGYSALGDQYWCSQCTARQFDKK
jgi:hypothetical protein